jgi:hypothetical protein
MVAITGPGHDGDVGAFSRRSLGEGGPYAPARSSHEDPAPVQATTLTGGPNHGRENIALLS